MILDSNHSTESLRHLDIVVIHQIVVVEFVQMSTAFFATGAVVDSQVHYSNLL